MVNKDERSIFVENVSYKFGYTVVTFALLLDVMYRSLRFKEAPWDLLLIIFLSGLVMTVYQFKQKIFEKAMIKYMVITLVIAAIFGFLASFFIDKL
jgi:RsiW-degrading membrane proteinase PrsW (M82 family)